MPCDPGYEQCDEYASAIDRLAAENATLRKLALEGAGWAALIKPNPPLAYIAAVEHACGVTPSRENDDAA